MAIIFPINWMVSNAALLTILSFVLLTSTYCYLVVKMP